MKPKMKGITFVVLLTSLWSLSCSGQSGTTTTPTNPRMVPADFDRVFEGTLNNRIEIEMKLRRKGDILSGTYSYRKYGLDIPIKGTIDTEQNFVIREHGAKDGSQTGTFEGAFVSDSEIRGTWSKVSGDKVLAFWLKEKASDLVGSASPPGITSTPSGTSSLEASSSSSSPSSSRPASDAALTLARVQPAVDQALDWTRKGGGATVTGIQEIPQQNAARADIRFDQFQFNANSYGMPVDKNKKTPPEPGINDPKFYEKMYQSRRPDSRGNIFGTRHGHTRVLQRRQMGAYRSPVWPQRNQSEYRNSIAASNSGPQLAFVEVSLGM